MAMYAWHVKMTGGAGFWAKMHTDWWRWYIIGGSLFVPACAYFLKED
jgi:hypothetical protein